MIHLDLKPEVEALLTVQASAQGVSVEQYLQTWIETNFVAEGTPPFYQTATTEEWLDAFTTWAKSHASSNEAVEEAASSELSPSERAERFVNWTKRHASKVPPLSDEAISRESIYREREDQQL